MENGVAVLCCGIFGCLAGCLMGFSCFVLTAHQQDVNVHRKISLHIVSCISSVYVLNGVCLIIAAAMTMGKPHSDKAASWACTTAGIATSYLGLCALGWTTCFVVFVHRLLVRSTPATVIFAQLPRCHLCAWGVPLGLVAPLIAATVKRGRTEMLQGALSSELPWCLEDGWALLLPAFGGHPRGWRMLTFVPTAAALAYFLAAAASVALRFRALTRDIPPQIYNQLASELATSLMNSGACTPPTLSRAGSSASPRSSWKAATWDPMVEVERRLGTYGVVRPRS